MVLATWYLICICWVNEWMNTQENLLRYSYFYWFCDDQFKKATVVASLFQAARFSSSWLFWNHLLLLNSSVSVKHRMWLWISSWRIWIVCCICILSDVGIFGSQICGFSSGRDVLSPEVIYVRVLDGLLLPLLPIYGSFINSGISFLSSVKTLAVQKPELFNLIFFFLSSLLLSRQWMLLNKMGRR